MPSLAKVTDTQNWATPQALFEKLMQEFRFTMDGCANATNTKHAVFSEDLLTPWGGHRVFMNPPYGRHIAPWMAKAAQSDAELVVCLVCPRTDTLWWHRWVEPFADELRFFKGRIAFEHPAKQVSQTTAPSCLVIYRNEQRNRTWGSACAA